MKTWLIDVDFLRLKIVSKKIIKQDHIAGNAKEFPV